jgi:small subunit ribosomal protein S17
MDKVIQKQVRLKKGKVVKLSSDRTVCVLVTALTMHKRYRKVVKISKKYAVHLPENVSPSVGDMVVIFQVRPVSKNKTWCIKSIAQ